MKLKAYTLTEILISAVIVGIFGVVMMHTLRPDEYKVNTYKKAGSVFFSRVDVITKQILNEKTRNNTFLKLVDDSQNIYSINDIDADEKLILVYKKYLQGMRDTQEDEEYQESKLIDSEGNDVGSYKVSDFSKGFYIKNGAYFAIKLNNNCTTDETTIYHPIMADKREQENSCGLIFYDVNGQEKPNSVGVDQYIISIGQIGIY